MFSQMGPTTMESSATTALIPTTVSFSHRLSTTLEGSRTTDSRARAWRREKVISFREISKTESELKVHSSGVTTPMSILVHSMRKTSSMERVIITLLRSIVVTRGHL